MEFRRFNRYDAIRAVGRSEKKRWRGQREEKDRKVTRTYETNRGAKKRKEGRIKRRIKVSVEKYEKRRDQMRREQKRKKEYHSQEKRGERKE